MKKDSMKKILVIDDSSTVRQQVGLALHQAGHTILEASDGLEGLVMLKKGGVSMAICDVNMPRMSGIDMLEKMKLDLLISPVPVLMLTTEGQKELVDRAKAAGAVGWIVKPFNAQLMVAAVNKIIASWRGSGTPCT